MGDRRYEYGGRDEQYRKRRRSPPTGEGQHSDYPPGILHHGQGGGRGPPPPYQEDQSYRGHYGEGGGGGRHEYGGSRRDPYDDARDADRSSQGYSRSRDYDAGGYDPQAPRGYEAQHYEQQNPRSYDRRAPQEQYGGGSSRGGGYEHHGRAPPPSSRGYEQHQGSYGSFESAVGDYRQGGYDQSRSSHGGGSRDGGYDHQGRGGYDDRGRSTQDAYADRGSYGAPPPSRGGYDAPPASRAGYDAPPSRGSYDAPPPSRSGYDAPPSRGGYDAPPSRGSYDAPPARGSYEAPPPSRGGYDAPSSGRGGYDPPPPPRGGYDAPPPSSRGGYDGPAAPRGGGSSQGGPPSSGGYVDRGGGGFGGGRGRGDFGGRGRGRGDFGGRGRGRGGGGGSVAPATAFVDGLLEHPASSGPSRNAGAFDSSGLMPTTVRSSSKDNQLSRLPQRPGTGKKGRPVTVLANFFLLQFDQSATEFAIHFDVEVKSMSGVKREKPGEEKGLPAETCRLAMKQLALREQWPVGWSFDGRKNMYAPGRFLKEKEQTYTIECRKDEDSKPESFHVRVRQVAVASFADLREWLKSGRGTVPHEALQAIDVVLRHRVTMFPDTVTFGRSIFVNHPATQIPIGDGTEVWVGYQQAARPCQRGIAITLNQAASAFVSAGPILEHIAAAVGCRVDDLGRVNLSLGTREFRAAKKAVSGVKVEVRQMNAKRKYRVNGLASEPADRDEFDHTEWGRMTVAQYFERQHGQPLRYPGLPCLQVGGKGVRIPPEVCSVVGGMRVAKLTSAQTLSMLTVAKAPPHVKREAIETQVNQNLQFHLDPQPAAFGINVATTMTEVRARVLDSPVLEYSHPRRFQVKGGSWNLRQVQFKDPGRVRSWVVCCFVPQHQAERGLPSFVSELTKMMGATGMRFDHNPQPEIRYCNLPRPDRLQRSVEEELMAAADSAHRSSGSRPNLIVCVLPTKETELYRTVKRAGDHVLGIVTQCAVATNAGVTRQARGRDQYLANICMKINSKLGGANVSISGCSRIGKFPHLHNKVFMLLGADVTHSTISGGNHPSVAAVVGTTNYDCTRYAARIHMQGPREELIRGLDTSVQALLMEFYRGTNGMKPEHIIFYRDGVAEGQFAHCLDVELPQLRKAFRDISGDDYQPLVTFVIVQKRHSTRLFPNKGEGDRKGNIHAGTVVDQDICHPHEFDFYLASHEGLQGTVRPVHYHVLLDENKFPADDLQTLTHHLCFTYCRCTRSVSIVPPAYYAHLAAERGRLLCSAYNESDNDSLRSGGPGGKPVTMDSINKELEGAMFFV